MNMKHDQNELNNLSGNAIRDYAGPDDSNHFEAVVQRASRHYAEYQCAELLARIAHLEKENQELDALVFKYKP